MKTKPTYIWVVEHRERYRSSGRFDHVLMQLCSSRKRALGYLKEAGSQERKGYFALTREVVNGDYWMEHRNLCLAFYDLKGKRLKEQPI